jgi:tetratricopeptide (TPR) repeat protein
VRKPYRDFAGLVAGLWLALLMSGCQPQSGKGADGREVGSAPPKLVAGLGPVHHPVTTINPQAQKYFDQGLAYLYGFNRAEAVRSFAYAAELDPKLAMAHWGRAVALGPNINAPEIDEQAANAAYEAAQRAVALAGNATVAERGYIEAVAKRYAANPRADARKLAYDYKVAMGQLRKRYPDDLDAATLYAESAMNLRPWHLYTRDGKPEEGTSEIVEVLEWVLARNPNHVGANHYYIHATEASNQPQRGLAAAQRLPRLAPGAGHLVHMPAHVYFRTGDYAAAIRANEQAAAVDEAYISCCASRRGEYAVMYYSHNLHFLAVAAAMGGRSKEATATAAKLAAHIDAVIDRVPALEAFGALPVLISARQADWGAVLRWPEPKADRHASLAAWHFARGLAHAAMKDIGPALIEHDAFNAEAAKAKDLSMGNNTAGQVFGVADHLLSGKVFAARGDDASARRELELTVAAQDGLDYDEPPAFPWPVRESLGAHLLRSGDAVAAERVFREDLLKNPNNPRSLFGLAETLKARGRHYDAGEVMRQFEASWSGADMKLRIEEF